MALWLFLLLLPPPHQTVLGSFASIAKAHSAHGTPAFHAAKGNMEHSPETPVLS